MNAKITEAKNGWVLYDGECSLCIHWASRFEHLLRRRGFQMATLQSRRETVFDLSEMRVLTPDGRTFGGADGLVQIARHVWWTWPLFLLAETPGAMMVLRAGYRWLARNRHCTGGVCRGRL